MVTFDATEDHESQDPDHIREYHAEQPPVEGEDVANRSENPEQEITLRENAQYEVDTGNDVGDAAHAEHHSSEPVDGAAPTDHAHVGSSHVESTRSSQTVQGDNDKNTAGEYDEDTIDWDDESDLTTKSSESGVDDHDDFSALLTEYEAEEDLSLIHI